MSDSKAMPEYVRTRDAIQQRIADYKRNQTAYEESDTHQTIVWALEVALEDLEYGFNLPHYSSFMFHIKSMDKAELEEARLEIEKRLEVKREEQKVTLYLVYVMGFVEKAFTEDQYHEALNFYFQQVREEMPNPDDFDLDDVKLKRVKVPESEVAVYFEGGK